MYISTKDWNNFIGALSKLNQASADAIVKYVNKYGFGDTDALVGYAKGVVDLYGNASASLAAQMYDEIAELEGKFYEPAELADTPDYGEVAKTVYGVLKTSDNPKEMGGAVSRLVKRTGQDTLLQNGIRDGAEFAWIPNGDTCAFCLTLASRGWQKISKKALKNGHAEHIHSNCNCSYMIRHSDDVDVAGYEPEKYYEMYQNAEGKTPNEKINSLRRIQYAEKNEVINALNTVSIGKEKNTFLNVTDEYLSKAKPGVGNIIFDINYSKEDHKEEIDFANWIHNILGGNIKCLSESTINGQKMPDFIWQERQLELKGISSLKSIDRQIHKAVKQIDDNGIIAIDISGYTEDYNETIKEIEYRFPKRARGQNDLIIKNGNKIVEILRAKK